MTSTNPILEKAKILIVDDELIIASDIQSIIERLGFRVTGIAEDAAEAWKMVEKELPDLILMDIRLRGKTDGITLSEEILNKYDIPIVFISAFADNETLDRAKKIEPYSYLTKPFNTRDLHSAVEIALYKHSLGKKLKESEARLKKSETLLNKTQEIAKVGGWEWDIASQTMYWTDECYRIHDMEPEEVEPGSPEHIKRSLDCYPSQEREKILKAFELCCQEGTPYKLESLFLTYKGRELWVQTSGEAVYENGKITKVIGNILDITERKQAEAHNRLLATMLDTAPSSITVHNANGEFLYANQKTFELHGFSKEEFFALNLQNIDVPESAQHTEARIQKIAETGEVSFESSHYRKDGSAFPLHILSKSVTWNHQAAILSVATDISEQKAFEQALVEREEQIQSIFRSAPVGIGMLVDRVFKAVNPSTTEITGYSREELIGQSARMLYATDEDFNYVEREKYAQIAKYGRGAVETRWKRKDGEIRQILLSSTPIDLKDLSKGVTFSAQDITERKQAEKALRESEERFKALHNSSFGGITIHDKGLILECNQGLSDITGWSYDELIGMDGLLLIAESSRNFVRSQIAAGYEKAFEAVGIRKNGEEYPLRLEARSIPYKRKQVRVVEFRDITEQKAAEAALQESEYKFRSLIDQAAEMLFLHDTEGKIIEVNRAAIENTGYSREELCNMNVMDIDPDVIERDDLKNYWKKLQIDSEAVTFESRHKRKDGAFYPVENTIAVVQLKDKNYLFALARNISERKEAEAQQLKLREQLIQAQKMESVGRLAGGVAHDFNNMLMVIMGQAELAMGKISPDDKLYSYLTEINKAGERSANLTRQLLAFARRQTIQPRIVNLNDIVSDMLKMLRRLVGENIDLVWQPGAKIWPIRVDPAQIDQILANLSVNARDAIDNSGFLILRTNNVTLDEDYCGKNSDCKPGEYVQLVVSDTGCGMSKEVLENLFEPFFTTKAIGEGTGLGLSTVYGIVKQNNGHIKVYSELDMGSTFNIYFPRYNEGILTVDKLTNKENILGGNGTILLVEDEAAILHLNHELLNDLGYTVLKAISPDEAIKKAASYEGKIHLLLTDVIMPGMNGRQLAEQLIANRPDMKIIYMSGYTSNVIARHGVLDKGVQFIQKPFTKATLAKKIRQAINDIHDKD
ncbi:MAG TPA: PAS domain S-box protein [Candidatus Marinimicrobia bacterium]|nr:PAS domain S-box protein [Candidatus Neomarinimicrobiota bacterium]